MLEFGKKNNGTQFAIRTKGIVPKQININEN